MRTRLALSAALPLVAALAACSTAGAGNPAGTATSPSTTTSSPAGTPKSTVQDVTSHPTTTTNDGVTHSRPTPPPHRPTVQDALDTVRAYMQRELGMRDPRLSGFRWTGTDTATVDVRPWIASQGTLGPTTTVSLQRLRTVWFVAGARTAAIEVDASWLTGMVGSPVRIAYRMREKGPWTWTITQDRYGRDVVLGSDQLYGDTGRTPMWTNLDIRRPTGGTGSVIFADTSDTGDGALRATVIRVRFVPGPNPPSCAPAAFLPALRSWVDDPSIASSVSKVRVLRCRDEFAHVVATDSMGSLELYLQYWNRRWHSLAGGAHVDCDAPDRVLEQACKVLGYTD